MLTRHLEMLVFIINNILTNPSTFAERAQRGTCTYVKGLFWPPLEPKTENCDSPIYFDWFIRRITEV